MTPSTLDRLPLPLFTIERSVSRLDTTRPLHSALHLPEPAPSRPEQPLTRLAAIARAFGAFLASLNVNLDRRKTAIPGLSDRAIAQLPKAASQEDIVRWNLLAQQYGGTRIRQ